MILFKNRKKNKKTVFVHIGFMKTGTTAIQHFLIDNNDILKKQDVRFSEVNHKAMNYLAFCLMDQIPPYIHHTLPVTRELLYLELVDEIRTCKESKIVISSEAFALLATNHFLDKSVVTQFKKLMSDVSAEFKIVAFVRRQDEYADSQYNQYIKTHNFHSLYSKSIEKFIAEKTYLFDFQGVLAHFLNVFGKGSLIVKAYDSMHLREDFCSTIGVKMNTNFSFSKKSNPRLSLQGLEIMKVLNLRGIDKSTSQKNNDLVSIVESQIESPVYSPSISIKSARKLMHDYYQHNKDISDLFFDGNTSWFDNEDSKIYTESRVQSDLTKDQINTLAESIWKNQSNNSK